MTRHVTAAVLWARRAFLRRQQQTVTEVVIASLYLRQGKLVLRRAAKEKG